MPHNHLGLIVNWDCDTANVHDGSAFQHLVDGVSDQMVVFADVNFAKADWFPSNLRLCRRGEWNSRMLVETILSMLTLVCHFKKSHAPSLELLQNASRLYNGFGQSLGTVEWIVD